MDPLAEQMASWSSYNYAFSNPVIYIDPTGMAPEVVKGPDDWVLGKNGKYIWDEDVTSTTDPDLNGREYIGVSYSDVQTDNEDNNNWFSRTFFESKIDGKSFTKYLDKELTGKLEAFLNTGEDKNLEEIRGFNENKQLYSSFEGFYTTKNMSMCVDGENVKVNEAIWNFYKERGKGYNSIEVVTNFKKNMRKGKLRTSMTYPFQAWLNSHKGYYDGIEGGANKGMLFLQMSPGRENSYEIIKNKVK